MWTREAAGSDEHLLALVILLKAFNRLGYFPADLINIALERLVEGSYELPAFRTLNDMATTIRARVNEEIFATVLARLGDVGAARLERLLQALDDTAEMFCHRVATLTKRSRDELEALKQQHREITERLVANYRSVLERIDPDGPASAKERAALVSARKAVEAAGGFGAQYSDIDKVTAHHGDNHVPLVALPVYALAHLFGFDLMSRVCNWKDLNFYRLPTYSRRNNFYKAFCEVGRVIRTVQLLRFLSDPQLRRRTTAETNKVESYNQFSSWCRFGNTGVIAHNDPVEQEKILKFSALLTNAVIFHTTLDMMTSIREDRPHPALRRLRHRRGRPGPQAIRRPPRLRPGRRVLTTCALNAA